MMTLGWSFESRPWRPDQQNLFKDTKSVPWRETTTGIVVMWYIHVIYHLYRWSYARPPCTILKSRKWRYLHLCIVIVAIELVKIITELCAWGFQFEVLHYFSLPPTPRTDCSTSQRGLTWRDRTRSRRLYTRYCVGWTLLRTPPGGPSGEPGSKCVDYCVRFSKVLFCIVWFSIKRCGCFF